MDRRGFLRGVGAVSGSTLLPVLSGCGSSDPVGAPNGAAAGKVEFLHGVASGDPLTDRVMLWTRVTPEVAGPVRVRYRVAVDPAMTQVRIDEQVITDARRDYTVKVDPVGLEAGTTYYYQFEAAGQRSPVGRTKTLPVGPVERLRIAFTSCSNYPAGYFSAYAHIAARSDLDAVLHLGDYIYEYADGKYGDLREHVPLNETVTLADYRTRHAHYRTDPDLQACHQQHPMICVWDDHESANNSWRDGALSHSSEGEEGPWSARKAASIQACFEWLPIRLVDPADPQRIWRQFRFGDLVDLIMLDTRLYGRDQQLPLPTVALGGPQANDPNRQLLGERQQSWLAARLIESPAQWKLIGQQVMFGQLRLLTLPEIELLGVQLTNELLALNSDQWDGYPAARQRVFDAIEAGGVENVVMLAGDIHSSAGVDLFRDPGELANLIANTVGNPLDLGLIKALAVELASPSVSSPPPFPPGTTGLLRTLFAITDPHIQYFQGDRHGYVLLDITAERCQGEWWYVDTVAEPGSGESFGKALITRSGESRLRVARHRAIPGPTHRRRRRHQRRPNPTGPLRSPPCTASARAMPHEIHVPGCCWRHGRLHGGRNGGLKPAPARPSDRGCREPAT